MLYSYKCPYCKQNATINQHQRSESNHIFHSYNNLDRELILNSVVVVCPNPECREFSITALLATKQVNTHNTIDEVLMRWQLKPNSAAIPLPDYIPEAIITDYEEACLIRDLSPKSSATLARRCLQGILRDFWKDVVTPGKLVNEIKSIQDKVDPITWQAIDGVRSIGNIGAHMENDINVIVDVEPEEAQLLIGLLEHLIKEWYINRHERQKQMEALIGLAGQKQADRKKAN